MICGWQSMSMTMSGDFAGAVTPTTMVMDMSIDVAGQQMQMRVVDQSLYMKGPGMSASPGSHGSRSTSMIRQPVRLVVRVG